MPRVSARIPTTDTCAPEMRRLIEENTLGLVATVTPDGAPNVWPKATTVVLDDRHLVFSDLRSPRTVANSRANPRVEINYVDIFRRLAVRVTGTAQYHPRSGPRYAGLLAHYADRGPLVERMRGFVEVEVTAAQLIRSPAYDMGATVRTRVADLTAIGRALRMADACERRRSALPTASRES